MDGCIATSPRRLGVRALVALACALAALLALPRPALAESYEMGPVAITATVRTDGTLHVVEDRAFDFEGEFNGVYWDLPNGDYHGQQVSPEILQVGLVQGDGTFIPFRAEYTSEPRTYEAEAWEGTVRLTLFNPASDERITYRVVYDLKNAVFAWADTAELYWKFVSAGWEEPTRDITCSIHLPVPEGETIAPGENVRAWGHGPLDSQVSFDSGGDVVYTVPEVGTDQYAEARVLFPVSWLTVPARGEARLDAILAEEAQWADEANAQRAQARVVTFGSGGVVAAGGAAAILFALLSWASYRRRHRADFQDPYWREAPSKDHPAIVGLLVNGEVGSPEFTATLMRLTDRRAIGLDHVDYKRQGAFKARREETYRLVLHPKVAAALTDPIDEAAITFLFEDVAPKTQAYRRLRDEAEAKAAETGEAPRFDPTLDLDDMRAVAKDRPESYMEDLDDWKGTVSAQAETRGLFDDGASAQRNRLYAASALSILLTVAGFIAFIIIEPPAWFLLLLLLPIAGAVLCGAMAKGCEGYSDEADEIRAKALALRAWLKDFTRLDEAVPEDVALWNELLVYAVVLGVADDVIRQLKIAMPQIFDDPYFYPYYVWYYGYGHYGSPLRAFNDAYDSCYRASTAAVAASSNSSAGGAGGGFSGGGGGGIGGGGGGAF